MSAKWHRSRAWDDEHFPAWAWPAKRVLRAFSSITLAVVLLSLVAVYAILASIPIGLLALVPTFAFYALTLLAAILVLAVAPAWVAGWALRAAGAPGSVRFLVSFAMLVMAATLTAWAWFAFAWPAMRYDPATGEGIRFFAAFGERYKSASLRRLPGFEMSELEFYAWWPLRIVLLAFVVNMVVATLRRIEFSFVNLGVLTVHTGIVVIALGSVYYKGLKREGSAILWAGMPSATGAPSLGPPQSVFYDNSRIALYVSQERGWEQRRIVGLPRYNDYNLDALPGESFRTLVGTPLGAPKGLGALDLRVRSPRSHAARLVDEEVRFRIIGYASYARAIPDMRRAEPPSALRSNPMRILEVLPPEPAPDSRGLLGALFPRIPALRVAVESAFELEYTIGMAEARWQDLSRPLPPGTEHAIIIRLPSEGSEAVLPIALGESVEHSGHRVEFLEHHPEPPFPIITRGYEEASSSVAVVRVTKPDGSTFDRWVYHRFPEISQDFVPPAPEAPPGPPVRRPPDPSIDLVYLDATLPHLFVDELSDGSARAMIRRPGGEIASFEGLRENSVIADPALRWSIRLGDRWPHAEPVEQPRPIPEGDRRRDFIGTHDSAMIALEVTVDGLDWKQVRWIPFTSYPGSGYGEQHEHEIILPDSRAVKVMWGRLQHPFPDFVLQLADFQIEQYDHRGAPRDFRSVVRVTPSSRSGRRFEPYEHVTRLNAPLQAPFLWSEQRPLPMNIVGLLASRLDAAQFKLSQAGWDAGGWRETQELADQGRLPRPFASFTILGVGNNPGIHVVALGGVLVIVGTPWAFYVKPWILRRRKRKIQENLARAAPRVTAQAAP